MPHAPKLHITSCGFIATGEVEFQELNQLLVDTTELPEHAEALGSLTLTNFYATLHNGYERLENTKPDVGLFVVHSIRRIQEQRVAYTAQGRLKTHTDGVEALGQLIHQHPSAYNERKAPIGVAFDGHKDALYRQMKLSVAQYNRKQPILTAVVEGTSPSLIQQFMKRS